MERAYWVAAYAMRLWTVGPAIQIAVSAREGKRRGLVRKRCANKARTGGGSGGMKVPGERAESRRLLPVLQGCGRQTRQDDDDGTRQRPTAVARYDMGGTVREGEPDVSVVLPRLLGPAQAFGQLTSLAGVQSAGTGCTKPWPGTGYESRTIRVTCRPSFP